MIEARGRILSRSLLVAGSLGPVSDLLSAVTKHGSSIFVQYVFHYKNRQTAKIWCTLQYIELFSTASTKVEIVLGMTSMTLSSCLLSLK